MASPATDVLQFDAATHTYMLGGRRMESVTEVLERTGISDYLSLPEAVRAEALRRGRIVHEAIALDIEGDLDEESVPQMYRGYVLAARHFRREKGFQAELYEHQIHNPKYSYAGTLDAKGYASVGDGKQKYLVDWKTGVAPYWVRFQLAAYAACFPSPGAELRLCVELHENGTYRMIHFPASDFRQDFDVFLSALTVLRIRTMGAKL